MACEIVLFMFYAGSNYYIIVHVTSYILYTLYILKIYISTMHAKPKLMKGYNLLRNIVVYITDTYHTKLPLNVLQEKEASQTKHLLLWNGIPHPKCIHGHTKVQNVNTVS